MSNAVSTTTFVGVKSIQKRSLYRTLGDCCHYCSTPMTFEEATLDHIIPVFFGGPHALWNQVLACADCNRDKGFKVGLCSCDRCAQAIHRFTQSDHRLTLTRRRGRNRPRNVDQAIAKINSRLAGVRRSLNSPVAADLEIAAALRNKAAGLQEALDIIRTVVPNEEE